MWGSDGVTGVVVGRLDDVLAGKAALALATSDRRGAPVPVPSVLGDSARHARGSQVRAGGRDG